MRAAEVSGPGSEAAVRLEVVATMARTLTCDVVLVVLLLDGGSIRFGVEGRSWLDTLDTMRSELESKGIEVGSWSASPCDVGIVRLHSAIASCGEEWRCTTPGWTDLFAAVTAWAEADRFERATNLLDWSRAQVPKFAGRENLNVEIDHMASWVEQERKK